MANFRTLYYTLDPVEPNEPPPGHDLAHHVASLPLEMQYSEVVAIHFASFTLSHGPLVLLWRRKAKKYVKYIWFITFGLLPCGDSVQQPPIALHNISYAISYARSLIKRGKTAARLLTISNFKGLTHTYPDNDVSFVCNSPGGNCTEDTISIEDGPFRHPAIGMIICRMLTFDLKGDICLSSPYFYPKMLKVFILLVCSLIRFALDELQTGAYLRLSFSEWNQEYLWDHLGQLWKSVEGLQGGPYLNNIQRDLATQLR
ncbi:hypothetical protein FRC01_002185 [Tulasnella sp. 417]|nr:hypothetical protein FRC01_002185 [Tulasnella sp. 417]